MLIVAHTPGPILSQTKVFSTDFQSLKISPGPSLPVVIDRNKVQKLRKSIIDKQLLKNQTLLRQQSVYVEQWGPSTTSLNNRQPTGNG